MRPTLATGDGQRLGQREGIFTKVTGCCTVARGPLPDLRLGSAGSGVLGRPASVMPKFTGRSLMWPTTCGSICVEPDNRAD